MAGELIDSHCHLNFDYSPKTADDLIREAAANGVVQMINVSTDLERLDQVPLFSEHHPNIFHTIGLHPHESSTLKPEHLALLKTKAEHPKCVAIGEIGLDYYYNHSTKDEQIHALQQQLDLALDLELPVVIHSRDAEADLLPALQSYAKKAKSTPGIIHCFTGTQQFGQACIDAGFYISFSGILTFKNATDLQASAKAFGMDKILVETDSPFLAPVPYRGKKCEPSMVKMTALKLAELKGVSFEEIADATRENTRKAFKLPLPS
ncbi:TatD family hydrolase [bacterium]|nr:TatD family hydrolase [bacterium]